MKKIILTTLLLLPLYTFAAPVSWDGNFGTQILQPLQSLWSAVVKASSFTSTSTTVASIFPYATTTYITASTASTTNLRVSSSAVFEHLGTGLAKITSGVLGLATAGVDYQTPLSAGTDYEVPLTFGDALTRTANDIDFDGGATPAGDLGGTWASPSVTDDSHAHTGATLSGIDISGDTNLTAGDGLTLTDDDLDCDTASGSVFGCLASADWTTFNNKLGSYDAWTHSGAGKSATTSDIGIGTTSPGTALGVTGDAVIAGQVTGRVFTATSTATASVFPYASTTALSVSGSGSAFVVSSGNVGIGTSTPLSLLSLNKSQSGLTTIGDARVIALQNSSGAANQLQEIGFGYQSTGSNHSQPVVIGHRVTSGSSNSMGDFYIATRSVVTDTFPTERLTVTAAGNVGIGTSTPQWLLNPFSATAPQLALSAGAGIAQWAFRNAGGNLYMATTTVAGTATTSLSALSILGSTGRVGIKTNSPSAALHIKSSDSSGLFLDTQSASQQVNLNFLDNGSNRWAIYKTTGQQLAIFDYVKVGNFLVANPNGDAYFTPGGNLGIGTTTPQWPLSIFSSTGPQLSLSADGGLAQWTMRNAGGNLYFATTTTAGTATTSTSALTLNGSGVPSLLIGTSTCSVGTLKSGALCRDSGVGTSASTTDYVMGKWQKDTYNSAGSRVCLFIVGTTLTASSGACNP